MSDGINLKARIHNTVLSLNDTPLFVQDVPRMYFTSGIILIKVQHSWDNLYIDEFILLKFFRKQTILFDQTTDEKHNE